MDKELDFRCVVFGVSEEQLLVTEVATVPSSCYRYLLRVSGKPTACTFLTWHLKFFNKSLNRMLYVLNVNICKQNSYLAARCDCSPRMLEG